MERAFNWAKMCDNDDKTFADNKNMNGDIENLKSFYKSIWIACLGSEGGFEEYFNKCKNEPNVDGTSFIDKVKKEYQETKGEELKGKNFTEKLNEYVSSQQQTTGDKFSPEVLRALKMTAAQTSACGYTPRDTTLAAGFLSGLGYNLQQGCGQGKTNGIALAAYVARGEGENVTQTFITSSTEYLAKQSFEETANQYSEVGLGTNIYLMTEKGPMVASYEEGKKNATPVAVKYVEENGIVREATSEDTNTKDFKELEPGQQKEALQAIYGNKENIIFADNATVVKHNMMGAIPSFKEGERQVIMDEGDYVKNDQFHYIQQLGDAYLNNEQQNEQQQRQKSRNQARNVIVEIKNKENLEKYVDKDEQTQFAQFNDAGIEAVKKYCAKNEIELTSEFMDFVEEALVVETVFKEGVDYVVEGNKVISQEKASGTEMDLPQGIVQALAVKTGTIYPEEKKVLNIQTIMGAYNKIFGGNQTLISGSHDPEEKQKAVVVANFKVSEQTEQTKSPETINNETTALKNESLQNTRYRTMVQTREDVDKAIIVETNEVLGAGRPVLIGCVSSADVEDMKGKLGVKDTKIVSVIKDEKGKEKRIITYTAETNSKYKEDKNSLSEQNFRNKYHIDGEKIPESLGDYVKTYGGKKDTITLGTSIIGRGANIGIKGEELENGGLHVITRGLHPSSVRQMIQFINRSKRGDNNGSSHEFFSAEELGVEETIEPETLQVDNDGNPVNEEDKTTESEQAYRGFYAKADERNKTLASKARSVEAQVTTEKDKLISKIKKAEVNSDEKQNIVKEILPEFMSRALSIQYKANGNTNEEIAKQHQDMIVVLREVYAAKIDAMINKKDFDEKTFLENYMSEQENNPLKSAAKRIFVVSSSGKMSELGSNVVNEALQQINQNTEARVEKVNLEEIEKFKSQNDSGDKEIEITPEDIKEATIQTGEVTLTSVTEARKSLEEINKNKQAIMDQATMNQGEMQIGETS